MCVMHIINDHTWSSHFKRVVSIGDGHCILHSLVSCLKSVHKTEHDVNLLLGKLVKECNHCYHPRFMTNEVKYIRIKSFSGIR